LISGDKDALAMAEIRTSRGIIEIYFIHNEVVEVLFSCGELATGNVGFNNK
jgi:hypothetical protein